LIKDPLDRESILPYTYQIMQVLKERIINDRLEEGDRLPNVRDIASEFGVSVETARSAINELKKQGVVVAQQGRGTFLQKGYRTLIDEEPILRDIYKNIGVLMPALKEEQIDYYRSIKPFGEPHRSWWTGNILHGMEREVHKRGSFLTLVSRQDEDIDSIKESLNTLAKQVGGIILFPINVPQVQREEILAFLDDLLIPWITINKWVLSQETNFISLQYEKAGAIVAEQFLSEERTSFLWIGNESGSSLSNDLKLIGFKEELKRLGIPERKILIMELNDKDISCMPRISTKVFEYLKANKPIDAIFCTGDYVALAAINGCRQRGLLVPEDVSVIGSTGLDICEVTDPPLSTLALPMQEMGREAVKMLNAFIFDNRKHVAGSYLEPRLILRGSTKGVKY
jgi:DNA-binding LacI/PurR family transcriptional regulator